MRNSSNIVIVGFTSCGKTTVGKELSLTTGLSFLDLDNVIEQQFKQETGSAKSCRQIYSELGKQVFRARETQGLKSLEGLHRTILSTGGGVVRSNENREMLKCYGTVVYLAVEPHTIYKRMLKSKGVPAYLFGDPSLENLKRAYCERGPVYSELADVVVVADDKTPREIAALITEQLDFSVESNGKGFVKEDLTKKHCCEKKGLNGL